MPLHLPDLTPARCPQNWDTWQTFSPQTCPTLNLPDVPKTGTPVKHSAPKPARCPSNWDTCQTLSPQTCPMSPKLGHRANIQSPNLPDVPLKGIPVKHQGPKPARCPSNRDTGQYSGIMKHSNKNRPSQRGVFGKLLIMSI